MERELTALENVRRIYQVVQFADVMTITHLDRSV